MTLSHRISAGLRPWAGGFAVALAMMVAALLIQHFRHGWPFSLHHGMAPPASTPGTMAGHDMAAHPRAAVQLDESGEEAASIRTRAARVETIAQEVRAVATVVPDEARVSHVHTRVAGWVERLYVSTTGQRVTAGEPLVAIFSQELLSSQNELIAARKAASSGPASGVLDASRARLRVMGMTDAEIAGIEESGVARRLVTLVAPRSGIVVRRAVVVGTAVDPTTELMTVADLSRVWVLAEVPEPNIPQVQMGTTAVLSLPGSGLDLFEAPVDFIYPTLSERTRTLRVRFSVANPGEKLRPGLYGSALFRSDAREALVVPRDAVVDTGESQHVFVAAHPGHFEPRPVKLGVRLEDRVEVREGLSAGDQVVVSGVFLIDSESRLRASGGGIDHAHGSSASKPSRSRHEGH